jgi:NAD(P) transhydrogenase subunit beta
MSTSVPLLLAYLASALCFILGLKQMSHPRSAVRGIVIAAFGMLVSIVATVLDPNIAGYGYIIVGMAIGTIAGAYLALTVDIKRMPQMVGLLNGLGGAASTLVAWADLQLGSGQTTDQLVAVGLSGLIGTVTFSGSMVAYAKLEEYKQFRNPFALPQQPIINGLILLVTLLFTYFLVTAGTNGGEIGWYIAITLLALVLGVFLVLPIGGADMPVVISLMNSYSGLAGAATGFVIGNDALIIAGSLVGASGVILTQIMCKAMNRSLPNVLFGKMAGSGTVASADEVYKNVRSTSPEDVAMILDGAQRVVIVPGYGMAVAQAQHAVRDLSKLLESKGCVVEYAIHPVAGRMPGHMNVLLAEADISYDKLKEMDDINPTLDTVDVAIVIGANDVVNPLAKTDPQSPIAGMPIIEVDKCRTVIVVKRSLSPGFAGIPNPLFALPQTLMLYADGQEAILSIVKEMKANA